MAARRNKLSDDLTFYRFIIENLPIAVITVNSELRITSFNPWAEKVTGYSAKEAAGLYCGDILQGGMCKMDCPLKRALNHQNAILQLDTTIQDKRGRTIPVRQNTAALLDHDGQLIGGVEAFQDVSYLKTLEEEKANLISMVAHDMKSSVAIIGGFVLRIMNKATSMSEAKQTKYLQIIKKEVVKLESIITDFLEFSRLRAGKLKLNFSATSVDTELMELFEAYHPRALKRGINLELQSADALPIIEADAQRLHRVFTNLLDNALKFSQKGGKITIATEETDQNIIVKFIDEGRGIDPRDRPHIFEPFHRGHARKKRDGFGLGLAAVRTLVEGHGGWVRVESELGKGSVFTVVLPKISNDDVQQ